VPEPAAVTGPAADIPSPILATSAETAVTFADLGLPEDLLAAVRRLGYRAPTAIQASAIPALLAGRDVTGVAQTGTGKTAAFGLPLLAAVDPHVSRVQSLVLAPTRELALQVAGALSGLAADVPGLEVVAVYGGAPMGRQLSALRRGAQIVVGTPGRIIDHLDRGSLSLDGVRFVVLDEADEMLRMGFAEDVDRILSQAPAERQTALFSATMPAGIRAVAAAHLRRPVDVSVAPSATPVEAIRQRFAVLPYRQKADALARILAVHQHGRGGDADRTVDAPAADAAVVFVRTRSACEEVGAELQARGIAAAVISGDVAQNERERTVHRLRERQLDVLVATDVAARGLDVSRIGLVVNFDAPADPETYIHRVGRTGRAGRTGEALLFVTPREMSRLRAIERATGQKLQQMVPPTAAEVAEHRAAVRLREATARLAVGRLDAYRAAVTLAAEQSGIAPEDLAAALLAVAAGDDGTVATPDVPERGTAAEHDVSRRRRGGDEHDGQQDAHGDPRIPARRRTDGDEHRGHRHAGNARSTRYTVQVGRRHGVRPAGIVGAITGEGGLSGADLGRIDIFDSYSVVEIAAPITPDAMTRIRRATVSGQQLRIRAERPAGAGRPERPAGWAARPTGRPERPAARRRADDRQNNDGWVPASRPASRRGRLPSGKRDSALPGTPRTS
jgi:ATP-dependent RNA helicase DeaD